MIPPRGCAYIVMVHRQDAFRALTSLSRGTTKVNQKAIKVGAQWPRYGYCCLAIKELYSPS